jgi:hypothetical protein
MAKGDLMNGVRTSRTIWHEARSAPGREGAVDLALFTGHIVYASGETATFAGVEVIDTTDGKETFTANETVLLEDGSVSTQIFKGEATFKEGPGRVGGSGTWEMVNGTGRFANLRGGGPFKWAVDGDEYRAEFSA